MANHWDFTYTDENLTREEASIITSLAEGRAIEFGSGRGLGTHALLAARCTYILSIEEDEDYYEECSARYTDPRVQWLHKPVNNDGWYDDTPIDVPSMPTPDEPDNPDNRYTTVLLDGPSGYPGRRHCLPMLVDSGPYLMPGWQVLVTHTIETAVQDFIKEWTQDWPIKRETIRCDRGMVRITAV